MVFRPAWYETTPVDQRMLPLDSSFLPVFCGQETISYLLFPGLTRGLQKNKKEALAQGRILRTASLTCPGVIPNIIS